MIEGAQCLEGRCQDQQPLHDDFRRQWRRAGGWLLWTLAASKKERFFCRSPNSSRAREDLTEIPGLNTAARAVCNTHVGRELAGNVVSSHSKCSALLQMAVAVP